MKQSLRFFDSHCHLEDDAFNQDINAVLDRMTAAGVMAATVIGIHLESARKAVLLAETRPMLYATVGIHPHDASRATETVIGELSRLAKHAKVCAWGEIGLDFNRMFSPKKVQETWFERQLQVSEELGLPVVFHERDTDGRFLEMLSAGFTPGRRGVVHCFSGNRKELFAYLDKDLYIGITGIITIQSRGAELRKMAADIPLERIVIETDAPFLTPVPERNRHRRNEPAFVATVFHKLAAVRGEDPPVLAEALWKNTRRLFGLSGD
jgi:TatD DNase family protein